MRSRRRTIGCRRRRTGARSWGWKSPARSPSPRTRRTFGYGARVPCAPAPCYNPWNMCYLSVDEEGRRQMIFCCTAFHYGVKYDKGSLTEEDFRKVWNHPTARHFRRTVNQKGANPICDYCQSVDRFDPENNRQYVRLHDGDAHARRSGAA